MKNWKVRLLVGMMLVATMLATIAGPAMANHTERHENRIDNRQDHDDNDQFDNVFFVNEIDDDDEIFFVNEIDDYNFVSYPFLSPFVFAVEEIDIDCDGLDDDGDWSIDEGADCEIEIEFFEF